MESKTLPHFSTLKILKNHSLRHGNNIQHIKNIYVQWKIDVTEIDK